MQKPAQLTARPISIERLSMSHSPPARTVSRWARAIGCSQKACASVSAALYKPHAIHPIATLICVSPSCCPVHRRTTIPACPTPLLRPSRKRLPACPTPLLRPHRKHLPACLRHFSICRKVTLSALSTSTRCTAAFIRVFPCLIGCKCERKQQRNSPAVAEKSLEFCCLKYK